MFEEPGNGDRFGHGIDKADVNVLQRDESKGDSDTSFGMVELDSQESVSLSVCRFHKSLQKVIAADLLQCESPHNLRRLAYEGVIHVDQVFSLVPL